MLVSKRGLPLVTQEPARVPVLTVEDYSKWYELFLVLPSGKVHVIHPWDVHEDCQWFDHCISPKGFDLVAQTLNANYDAATMQKVEEMFKVGHLDGADSPEVTIPEEYAVSRPAQKEYLSSRTVVGAQEVQEFLQTMTLEGHYTEFLSYMSAFVLNDAIMQNYEADFANAYCLAQKYRTPQVVEGEAPGFFVIRDSGIASWCLAYKHFDFQTDGEMQIANALDLLKAGSIPVDEFKRIQSLMQGK